MEKTTTDNMQGFTLYDESQHAKIGATMKAGCFFLHIEENTGFGRVNETNFPFTPEQFQTFVDSCNDLIAVSKGDFPFKPNWAYTATRKSDGATFLILGVSPDKRQVLTGGLLPSVLDILLFENFAPAHELQRNELIARTALYIKAGWV